MGGHGLMAPMIDLIEFSKPSAMATNLADRIVKALERSIARKGQAILAASGGATPGLLYQKLSRLELDWAKVVILLIDERWVAPSTIGSNEHFIRSSLLQGPAMAATFIGLWREGVSFNTADTLLEKELAPYNLPPDVAIYGMGTDGHTASWFPAAEGIEELLATDQLVNAVTVPPSEVAGPYRQRMTLTPAALIPNELSLLLITGDAKKKIFEQATSGEDERQMPIRHLLHNQKNLWACWAPEDKS
ncbi:MAG: 6-phosphogluconolactonase [bacterium]